jgi:HAMP domain-containing protein
MKKIRNKIMLTMMVLTLLPAILIGAYSFYTTSEALKENALIEQRNQLFNAQQSIQATVSRVESDLLFLRDSNAMQLYLAAKKSSRKRSKLLLTNLRHLAQQFSQQQQIYSSVRYLDSKGQEQVRIEMIDEIATDLVKKGELINRIERDYFTEAASLQSNQVYISPLELRKNKGRVVEPYQATIRYSTAVRDADGNKQGVLVLNLNADSLITSLVGEKQDKWMVTLTDPEGFYFYHPDESKQWSGPSNLKKPQNIFDDETLELGSVKNSNETITSENESILVLSTPVVLGENRPKLGYLFNIVSKGKLFKPLEDYLMVSLIIAAVSLLLSLIFAAMLANSLSEPLVELKDRVESFSRGDLETPISVKANNEIGELSRAVELLRKSMNILMKRTGR